MADSIASWQINENVKYTGSLTAFSIKYGLMKS